MQVIFRQKQNKTFALYSTEMYLMTFFEAYNIKCSLALGSLSCTLPLQFALWPLVLLKLNLFSLTEIVLQNVPEGFAFFFCFVLMEKVYFRHLYFICFPTCVCVTGLSGAMASISMRSGAPGSPTHLSASSAPSRRRNGLHDVDLNTFIAEEMALHLDNGTRKRSSAQCNDVITDSPTHKRNRMI